MNHWVWNVHVRQQNHDRESCRQEIPELAGKTVRSARQEAGGFHSLDEGYATDGPVVIEFTDGTTLTVDAAWCNDDTTSVGYSIEATDLSHSSAREAQNRPAAGGSR